MVTVRELDDALRSALAPLLERCPEGRFTFRTGVQVGDFDVQTASRCQAAAAAPEDGFVPDVFTTFKALARGSVRRVSAHGGIRAALLTQVQAARDFDPEVDEWLCEHFRSCSQVELVETAHRAATWLHRTAAVLDDPSLVRHGPGRRVRWDHPDRALRLKATVDLIADDDNAPVIVLPSLEDARLDQAAFVAMLYALAVKAAPPVVRIVAHTTGELIERDRDDLWGRALSATSHTVEAVLRRSEGPEGLHRSASYFTCRECAWGDECDVRVAAESTPLVLRQGIRLPRH